MTVTPLFRVCVAVAFGGAACLGWTQAVGGNWQQTWGDEFNAGQTDLNGWQYDLGNNGWGNNELENYTNSSANSSVSNGALHITAISDGNGHYTSARIRSDALFSQTYGLFEFRAKLPTGQGLWPAVWMMPEGSTYGSWPNSGEMDILESKGQSDTLVQGSLHSGAAWNQDNTQTQTFAGSGLMPAGFSTHDWHTYDLSWVQAPNNGAVTISWYVDGVKYESHTGGWTVPNGAGPNAPFDKPFYLILNNAVGGNYVGSPNLAAGSYDMQVDYVRAYQAVPEPSGWVLLAAGLGVLALRRPRS